MPNKPNVVPFPRLHDDATTRYIDGFGLMIEDFVGGGNTTGRLMAYLLLLPAPVGLDQMAHDLEVSKSSISVAARVLEQGGLARRIPQRGSRRVLYEAVESFEGLIETEHRQKAMMAEKLRQGMEVAPTGAAAARMKEFADLYQFTIDEGRSMLRRWRERRSGMPGSE
jgi:DNA-binding transcriptional regulator GbsR (MarR family)